LEDSVFDAKVGLNAKDLASVQTKLEAFRKKKITPVDEFLLLAGACFYGLTLQGAALIRFAVRACEEAFDGFIGEELVGAAVFDQVPVADAVEFVL